MEPLDSQRPPRSTPWRLAGASAFVYVVATLVLGRQVLGDLSGRVLSDAGDPLLTAAILRWNATHVPLTDAWWQFPIFFPTRDTLTFSEHLLGLSVIATPLEWVIRNPIAAHNVVALLTFPLCAMAMYALVYRLTRSAPAAFIAGLAFGFAPYRVAQLPHVQMLATFYAPAALLGLHVYVESGRRRWLVLYGAAWALQGLANLYCVIFFSLLIALWGLWFVVLPRRWRALGDITAATAVASAFVAPVLYRYLVAHQFHGFVRTPDEMRTFSADVAGLLCAAPTLSLWGRLHVACRPEGQLFPGVATFALFLIGVTRVLGWPRDRGANVTSNRPLRIVMMLLLAVAVVYGACVAAILVAGGPVRIDIGLLHASASNPTKSALIGAVSLALALVARLVGQRGVTRPVGLSFYVAGAIISWVLALGPSIFLMGTEEGIRGPFAWLLSLPGTNGVRVPGRFWLMSVLCLSVVAGIVVAELLKNRRRAMAAAGVTLLACAVFSDGAVNHFIWDPAPQQWPNESALEGGRVLFLPVGQYFDIPSTYRAVTGHWASINGYSGYVPAYYPALFEAVRMEDPAMFEPFQQYGPLDVVVPQDAPRLRTIVEQQPGVVRVARDDRVTQYRLPARPVPYTVARGERLPISRVSADCAAETVAHSLDGDLRSAWLCPQTADATFTIDLARPALVGSVVTQMGRFVTEYAHALTVETSVDGTRWDAAWSGSGLPPLVWSAVDQPTVVPLTLSFPPRQARFIRLRQTGRDPRHRWGIAELQVWSQ